MESAALQATHSASEEADSENDTQLRARLRQSGHTVAVVRPMATTQPAPAFELCIVANDRPRLYAELVSLVGQLGLSIDEAHGVCSHGIVTNTFAVSGWAGSIHQLRAALGQRIDAMEKGEAREAEQPLPAPPRRSLDVSAGSPGDWEIDATQLAVGARIASGASGDVYHGTFVGSEVAIKLLAGSKKRSKEDADVQHFLHELAVMRRVRHRHIVQLIGACTTTAPHQLCIVTEFCSGGSLLERLRRLPALLPSQRLRFAHQAAQGMDYMHRSGIIHRDLKAADLLLSQHGDVKVSDFGVSRLAATQGEAMTAETGSYRWMAPEVFSHQPYDRKCDLFSYAVTLWEMEAAGRVPHQGLSPLQVALGVMQQGLRPEVPQGAQPGMARLMAACWAARPEERPEFSWVAEQLAEELEAVPRGSGAVEEEVEGDAGLAAERGEAEGRCGIGCGLGRLFRRT